MTSRLNLTLKTRARDVLGVGLTLKILGCENDDGSGVSSIIRGLQFWLGVSSSGGLRISSIDVYRKTRQRKKNASTGAETEPQPATKPNSKPEMGGGNQNLRKLIKASNSYLKPIQLVLVSPPYFSQGKRMRG